MRTFGYSGGDPAVAERLMSLGAEPLSAMADLPALLDA
jgi:hypothetical protein